MIRLALLAALLMPLSPAMAGGDDPCGAGARAHLIGQDAASLGALPVGARVLAPGDRRTMDWRPERLNIILDAQGRVRALRCG